MSIKYLLFILFLSFCNLQNTHSQELRNVVYIEYSTTSPIVNRIEYLYADIENALYIQGQINIDNEDNIILNKDNTYSVKPKKTRVNQIKIFSKINNPIVYFVTENPTKKTGVVAIDSIPEIKWKLISEDTKTIGGFECYKATANFRGSEITAYYSPEIPIPFGPFKFKGLPGLILEVFNTNSSYKYYWQAKKINFNPSNYVKNRFIAEDYNYLPTVSYKSIVTGFEKKLDNTNNILKSRNQDRGGTLQVGKRIRTGIEKVYEWEK